MIDSLYLLFFIGLYISNIVANVFSIITWDKVTSPATFIFFCILCGINVLYLCIRIMIRMIIKSNSWFWYIDSVIIFIITIMNCVGLSYIINGWIKSGRATTSPATFGFFIGLLQINIIYACLLPVKYLTCSVWYSKMPSLIKTYVSDMIGFIMTVMTCVGLSYLLDSWLKSGQATTSPTTFGFFVFVLQINIVYACLVLIKMIPITYFSCKKK